MLQGGIDEGRRQGWGSFAIDGFVEGGDRAAVAISWQVAPEGARHQLGHLLRLREGRIIDIQGYADPRKALRRVKSG